MRLKHNPWVSLLAALILTVMVLLYFTGCSAHAEPKVVAEVKESQRFAGDYIGHDMGIARYYTITDTKTGVQYLLVCNSYGAAMAELEG